MKKTKVSKIAEIPDSLGISDSLEIIPNTNDIYIKAKPYKVEDIEPKKRKFFIKTKEWALWKKRQVLRIKNPDKVILIRMEMSNGLFREFEIASETDTFVYKQGRYFLEEEKKYWIIERGIYAYDFHENLTLPIRKKIVVTDELDILLKKIEREFFKPSKPNTNINELRQLIKNVPQLAETENSLSPKIAKQFTDSEVIAQALRGAMLGKIFKLMFIFICIIGIIVLFIFMINLYSSGIFEKIGNVFHKGG